MKLDDKLLKCFQESGLDKNIDELLRFRNTDYLVSNTGMIFSCKYNKIRSLKLAEKSNGYLYVGLSIKGNQQRWYVHRMIADTFISSLKSGEVNHKDGNKRNNNKNNLEVVSHKQNMINPKRELEDWQIENYKNLRSWNDRFKLARMKLK